MVVAILMREKMGPPGTNEIYIFLAGTADTVRVAQEQGGHAGRGCLPSGQPTGADQEMFVQIIKLLLWFLNPERGLEKRWILILQLQHGITGVRHSPTGVHTSKEIKILNIIVYWWWLRACSDLTKFLLGKVLLSLLLLLLLLLLLWQLLLLLLLLLLIAVTI